MNSYLTERFERELVRAARDALATTGEDTVAVLVVAIGITPKGELVISHRSCQSCPTQVLVDAMQDLAQGYARGETGERTKEFEEH